MFRRSGHRFADKNMRAVIPGRREAASPEPMNTRPFRIGSVRVHGPRAPSLRSGPGVTKVRDENWLLRSAQGRRDTRPASVAETALWMADAIIAAQEISKRFGSVEVLRGVNL